MLLLCAGVAVSHYLLRLRGAVCCCLLVIVRVCCAVLRVFDYCWLMFDAVVAVGVRRCLLLFVMFALVCVRAPLCAVGCGLMLLVVCRRCLMLLLHVVVCCCLRLHVTARWSLWLCVGCCSLELIAAVCWCVLLCVWCLWFAVVDCSWCEWCC